jgi:hypothetical protein
VSAIESCKILYDEKNVKIILTAGLPSDYSPLSMAAIFEWKSLVFVQTQNI